MDIIESINLNIRKVEGAADPGRQGWRGGTLLRTLNNKGDAVTTVCAKGKQHDDFEGLTQIHN